MFSHHSLYAIPSHLVALLCLTATPACPFALLIIAEKGSHWNIFSCIMLSAVLCNFESVMLSGKEPLALSGAKGKHDRFVG